MEYSIPYNVLAQLAGKKIRVDKMIRKVIYDLCDIGLLEEVDDKVVFTAKFILELIHAVDARVKELGESMSPKDIRTVYEIRTDEKYRREFILNVFSERLVRILERKRRKKVSPQERAVLKALIDIFLDYVKEVDLEKYREIVDLPYKLTEVYVKWLKEVEKK